MITFLIKRWKEKELAKRICDILVGENTIAHPCKKEDGSWSLASDWFLNINLEEGTAKLTCRYTRTPEQWVALKVVIEMVL